MNFTSKDYVYYIKKMSLKFQACGDYITSLDAATGDGDHWVNINSGFSKLVDISNELENLSITDMFKKIGMTLMSSVGGSSGVLYGSAYLAASKITIGLEVITLPDLERILRAMLNSIMERGSVKVGQKTMVDALYPAVEALKKAIASDIPEDQALTNMKNAAIDGANATKHLEAVKGRASYQINKGVGHLDPGAITMSYQVETLADCILSK